MKNLISVFLLACCINNMGAAASPDLELLRKKVIFEMMQPQVNDARIKELMGTIQANGTWPDINYVDVSRTGFQHGEHLGNIVSLSRAFKKQGSKYKGNKQLKRVIYSAIDYWLQNDFICDNWWWNQIGTPDQFVRILLIMDDDLTAEQVTRSLPIAGRANLNASGARPSGDRIKIAGIYAKNALFQRNDSLFNYVIGIIEGEIKYANGPGLQYDLSFQHRPDKVTSTLSYGSDYADAFAEWAAFVAGTRYAFSEKSMALLTDYYLDGICETMVYGKYPDPGAKNRGITRVDALHQAGTTTPGRLLMASSYRKDELEKIIAVRKGLASPDRSTARYFWASEYFSFQRPQFFASVRMFSSRNHNMEMPYNSEGLMNHHYADGSNFISRTGKEYFNIFPVYDWQKIPGTTVAQKPALPPENEIQKPGLTEFTGAVTDGKYGAAVFDFKGLLDPVTAKKAWFFFDKEYVCLGTGINSGVKLPVVTTINQCLLKGDVTIMGGSSQWVAAKGESELADVKWILHDSIGYIFPEPAKLMLTAETQKGSWFTINRQSDSPKNEISLDVFTLWFDHGTQPRNASYQYIVVPGINVAEIAVSGNRSIVILANTTEIQAVMNASSGICQAVFYTSGELQVTPGLKIGMDSPGMVIISFEGNEIKELTVSDPSRRLRRIHLSVSPVIEKTGAGFSAVRDDRNSSVISVDLPRGVYAGKSVTVSLK